MSRLEEMMQEVADIIKSKKGGKKKIEEIQFLVDSAFELGYDDAMISYGLKDPDNDDYGN